MMNFDLAPLIKSGYKRFLIGPAFLGVLCVALACALGYTAFAAALFRGVVLGLLDVIIMMHGIRKAMPYAKEPEKGLRIMRRYRWYRVISASSIIILLLKQGLDVTGVFIGLLLTHIFLIIHLIFIAYRLNKEET